MSSGEGHVASACLKGSLSTDRLGSLSPDDTSYFKRRGVCAMPDVPSAEWMETSNLNKHFRIGLASGTKLCQKLLKR